MDTNPYKSPTEPNEPVKVRSRLSSVFDILAVICAGLPIAFLAAVLVLVSNSTEPSSPRLDFILNSLLITTGSLWLLAGFYNASGLFRRRRLPFIGMVLNVLSLLVWGGIFLHAALRGP